MHMREGGRWRCFLALGLSAILAGIVARGDDVATNAAPTPEPPPETHPDAPPVPDAHSGFSLHPDSSAPPHVAPGETDIFPEPTRPANPSDVTEDLAAHLLVVYNTADPDSEPLARYYAGKRNIPAERVLAITCPAKEEITRREFEDTVRSPITGYLIQKEWMTRVSQKVQVGSHLLDLLVAAHNDIWAIALIRGVPLKIAPDPSDVDSMEDQPALQTNAAAVDSELALLPVFGLPRGGFVPNFFFDEDVNGLKRIGPELSRNLVLVARLDGPTPADVRRMIDDSIRAEQSRLAGLAVIDSRGLMNTKDGYTSGDVWLRSARDALAADGWTVKFDDKEAVLPVTDPCNQVAVYLGWYSPGAIGPWITPPGRFVPGAIAYHLHSFSASTVRNSKGHWVGPLIANGADATMGMVYEPYLALTPHEDIFMRRLLQGGYFVEAAYAAERALSWMLTVVGDPLYRPFRVPLDTALAQAGTPRTAHDDWLLVQKVRLEIAAGQVGSDAASIRHALDVPGAGPVVQEALGDMLAGLAQKEAVSQAEDAYEKAIAGAHEPIDRIRVGMKLAQLYTQHGEEARAQSELDGLRSLYPDDARRFGIADTMVPVSIPGNPSARKTWAWPLSPFDAQPPVGK